MNKHLVVWAVEVEGSSPLEAAGHAYEIQQQPEHTASVFLVDGQLIDLPGDVAGTNAPCFAKILPTREALIDAYRRWHTDCPKNDDGSFRDPPIDDPEAQADTLLGFLKTEA
jgi:hypothetical protein